MIFGGGSGDFAVLPMEQRFALTNWTVEAWVRRNASEVDGGVICQRVVGPNGLNYELGLGDGLVAGVNVPYVRFMSTEGFEVIASGSTAIPANEWMHLAGSYNWNTRDLMLYLNSTNVDATSLAGQAPALYAGGPVRQRMGMELDGRLDDLRIWNVDRSQEDIADHYRSTIPGLHSNLVAYYRFDDDTGYDTNTAPVTGTSMNNMSSNGLTVNPWTWGQIQDNRVSLYSDWWDNWTHAASIMGNTRFSTNGGGAFGGTPQLLVNIMPTNVQPYAWWSVIGQSGSNQHGEIRMDLPEGSNEVECSFVQGWLTPSNAIVVLTNNMLTTLTMTYVTNPAAQQASLQVFMSPDEAWQAGATWQLDGVGSYTNAHIITGLSTGTPYVVSFNDTLMWRGPLDTNITLVDTNLYAITGVYTHVTGALMELQPDAARAAGAQWRIFGVDTNWLNSRALLELTPGTYSVEFRHITGWTEPEDLSIDVFLEEVTVRTNIYFHYDVIIDDSVVSGPTDVFIEPGQLMYVADTDNHRILVFQNDTNVLNTWGSWGTSPGQFKFPHGVVCDTSDNVYVADTDNHRIQRRDNGSGTWTTFGGTSAGTALGQFDSPLDVAMDASGNLYVADTANSRVQRRSSGGIWSQWIGSGTGNGQVNLPRGLLFAASGDLYVADQPAGGQGRIQRFNSSGVYQETVGTYQAGQGELDGPRNMSVMSATNLLVADTLDSQLMAKDLVNNVWWNLFDAAGAVNVPEGVDVDNSGYVFIADTGNDRILKMAMTNDPITGPTASDMSYTPGAGTMTITWPSIPTWAYRVEYNDDLMDGAAWQLLNGYTNMPGCAGDVSCVDSNLPVSGIRVYRVLGWY
jgi:hypothetical protein